MNRRTFLGRLVAFVGLLPFVRVKPAMPLPATVNGMAARLVGTYDIAAGQTVNRLDAFYGMPFTPTRVVWMGPAGLTDAQKRHIRELLTSDAETIPPAPFGGEWTAAPTDREFDELMPYVYTEPRA